MSDNDPNEFKDSRQIEIMINRMVKGKAPADCNWGRYHAGFKLEQLTPYQLAANVYRGYAFCPVYEGSRKQTNFSRAWHVAFDFDDASLEMVSELPWVGWFASFGYTTPSHTEDQPKCRVVFVFDEPIRETVRYRDLYHALAWRFHLDGIETDPACKDVLRLYYGSPGCEVWTNWSVLPADPQDAFIRQWREAVPERPRPKRPAYDGPPSTTEEAQIRDALKHIPPWGDYADWLTVLMAVHSALPGEAGIALCENWSAGKPGEVARKFASFNGGGVTVGTLFHLAKEHGWQPPAKAKGHIQDLRGRI